MPLTISHPAATILLPRNRLVFSALVIGSMTPDFPYYTSFLFSKSGISHSFIGLFTYCTPAGLVCLWVFHSLIKYPVLSLLPLNHQSRLYGVARNFSFLPLRRFGAIVLSLFIGALTHLAWDSITHQQGWIVQNMDILKWPVFAVPVYEYLQQGSTLAGGLLLIFWYGKWYKNTIPITVPSKLALDDVAKKIIFITMGSMALAMAAASALINFPSLPFKPLLVGHMFVIGTSSFAFEVMLFSIFWHLKKKTLCGEL